MSVCNTRILTDSQSHRIVWVGRDLWRLPSPTQPPAHSRGSYRRLPRSISSHSVNISMDGTSQPLWPSVTMFNHPHSKKKKVLACVQMEFNAFRLAPTASCPGHYCEEPVSLFFILSHQVFIYIDKTPLFLLWAEQSQHLVI